MASLEDSDPAVAIAALVKSVALLASKLEETNALLRLQKPLDARLGADPPATGNHGILKPACRLHDMLPTSEDLTQLATEFLDTTTTGCIFPPGEALVGFPLVASSRGFFGSSRRPASAPSDDTRPWPLRDEVQPTIRQTSLDLFALPTRPYYELEDATRAIPEIKFEWDIVEEKGVPIIDRRCTYKHVVFMQSTNDATSADEPDRNGLVAIRGRD
ncbi:hypothetical protein B0T22DRAFT_441868 [Podospora appendiculata]|uniref:Uncharacterized protein n=1 Tax=Podospora appendiculata TaxID=314037 RepID=A0AAE1CEI9_9PEZI|nr:hypothetical protein B0T22DRAFT_441868 [Podospora appendiculata]